jgi:hypothetical protein
VQFTSFSQYLVPVYEEQQARLERNIRLAEWAEMDVLEKALIIASRRIRIAVANLQSEAEIRDSKQKTKKR